MVINVTQILKDCGYSLLRHGKGDHDIYTDDKGRECVISRHATDRDIYTVNDVVSPFKIVVRIDMGAQKIKQSTTDAGLALSPIYQYMLYMLQYGEVMEIGQEAQKLYPELSVGDTAILHHSVEYDPHRLLSNDKGEYTIAYEYRIINCLNSTDREIFGAIKDEKLAGHKLGEKIVPFRDALFLAWDFEPWFWKC